MKLSKYMKVSAVAVAAVAMLLVSGCGGSDTAKQEAASQTITVKSAQGDVKVPLKPKRVVTLDVSALDTMDVFGVTDELAGVPQDLLPNYLSKFKSDKYTNVGEIKDLDLERIAKQKPDLIIMNSRQEQFYKQLSEIAPTIDLTVDNYNYWASVEQNITTLGQIFGKEDQAKSEIATLTKQMEDMKAKTAKENKRGAVIMTNGGKLRTFGPGSRYGFVYDLSGASSVVPSLQPGEDGKHGQNISFELLAQDNPDWMIVVDRDSAIGNGSKAQQLMDTDLVNGTTAGKTGHIVYVDSSVWYISPGGIQSTKMILDDITKAIE